MPPLHIRAKVARRTTTLPPARIKTRQIIRSQRPMRSQPAVPRQRLMNKAPPVLKLTQRARLDPHPQLIRNPPPTNRQHPARKLTRRALPIPQPRLTLPLQFTPRLQFIPNRPMNRQRPALKLVRRALPMPRLQRIHSQPLIRRQHRARSLTHKVLRGRRKSPPWEGMHKLDAIEARPDRVRNSGLEKGGIYAGNDPDRDSGLSSCRRFAKMAAQSKLGLCADRGFGPHSSYSSHTPVDGTALDCGAIADPPRPIARSLPCFADQLMDTAHQTNRRHSPYSVSLVSEPCVPCETPVSP